MLGQSLIQILLTKPSFDQWAYYTSLVWFKGQHEKNLRSVYECWV